MAKITKNDINGAPKYMLVIDYKNDKTSDYGCFDYKLLAAKDILTAMDEAESYFDETVYMTYILEKTEGLTDLGILYGSVLTSRTKGSYHRANEAHDEFEFWATHNPTWADGYSITYHGMER